jgi:hypothetical protein
MIDVTAEILLAVKPSSPARRRMRLAATAHIVELDIPRGDTLAALQRGRPFALSLRDAGQIEVRFELLGPYLQCTAVRR